MNLIKHINLGPLMLDIEGITLKDQEKELLKSPEVGGLILFSRNFESQAQLRTLVSEIRSIAPDILIAVDHEGGRVQRFREGFTRIPPMRAIGEIYQKDAAEGIALAKETGWLLAAELIAHDIDISFAPVLDIDYGNSDVIGDRAFSASSDDICTLSEVFMAGMKEAGMSNTGKHFPGHGFVAADSHIDIPVDSRAYQDIKRTDLSVFQRLVTRGLDAVMPAHVIYPDVDEQPAGFSSIWLQDILRTEFNFNGVIFSDDLGMEGASVAGSFENRTDAALNAGCDMILVCNKPEAAKQVLAHLKRKNLEPNARIAKMRLNKDKQLSWEALQNTSRWQNAYALINTVLADAIPATETRQVGE